MTSSEMDTDDLPLSPPVDPPTEEIAVEEPAVGFPDDVKEVWVYKRHIQTSAKQAGHDTCFILKRNTVDHKMYLSGPPKYVKVVLVLHHPLQELCRLTSHVIPNLLANLT